MKYDAIVVGVSAGGMEALNAILPHLPADFPLGVIVMQHMHPTSDDFLVRYLNERCNLKVKQADEKEEIVPGVIYVAPANYHLMVEEDRTFALTVDEPVNYARPSIDMLFETAADAYGARLVGVILTGASSDGSHGLKRIKESGGLAIVQDPETAEADTMPMAAVNATEVDYVLPLEEIGPFLKRLTIED
jgi:two-component system chemotaxis response regulator CheB